MFVLGKKKKKQSVAFLILEGKWGQNHFLPLPTFSPSGDNLSMASGGQMLIESDTLRCSFG